ncbi:prepilin peptidase [Lichenicoccus sp.]|uniref:prepilin peptidase n=1 Tax=Lichenicoccus sp. TaxID=2781899 RepID=UPI003D0BA72A
MHAMIADAAVFIAVLLLLVAAAGDVATRMVSNKLSILIALDGILLQSTAGAGLAPYGAALAVFVAGAICWRVGLMGGGDVKLLAAAALLVPAPLVPGLILSVALAGGILGLLYVGLRLLVGKPSVRRSRVLLWRLLRIEQYRISRGFSLPYASAIAAGAAFVLLEG